MLPILNQLKAETILDGTDIISKVLKLKSSLAYKTDEGVYSYEDYYSQLISRANETEQIQLETVVPPGAAQKYLVDLTQALQLVTDKIENNHTRALFFLGKINSAIHNRDNLLATFSVWYQIGVSDTLKTLEIKVPASTVKALAESEFSRILDDQDDSLDGMKAAIEVLIDHLKHAKKLALEKYKIGVEQANSSILKLPNHGFLDGGDPFPVLRQKYGLLSNVTDRTPAKYDDDEEESDTENPDYVEHRNVPFQKGFDAVVKYADLGVADETDIEQVKENWRKRMEETMPELPELPELPVVTPELESLEEEVPWKVEPETEIPVEKIVELPAKSSIDVSVGLNPRPVTRIEDDPFLGDVKIVMNGDGKPKVKSKRNYSFDDEEEVPAEPKPKYDDEEIEEPVIPTTPQKPKRERKQIEFDQPF